MNYIKVVFYGKVKVKQQLTYLKRGIKGGGVLRSNDEK